MAFLRFQLRQSDAVSGLAFRGRIVNNNTRELILRSVKLKRRLVHSGGKSGEPHLPIRVGASFEIELADSAKTIGDMNLNRRGVNRLPVGTSHSEFQRTGSGSAIHNGNFFVVRLFLSRGPTSGSDKNNEEST